jgi:hypothetical protein
MIVSRVAVGFWFPVTDPHSREVRNFRSGRRHRAMRCRGAGVMSRSVALGLLALANRGWWSRCGARLRLSPRAREPGVGRRAAGLAFGSVLAPRGYLGGPRSCGPGNARRRTRPLGYPPPLSNVGPGVDPLHLRPVRDATPPVPSQLSGHGRSRHSRQATIRAPGRVVEWRPARNLPAPVAPSTLPPDDRRMCDHEHAVAGGAHHQCEFPA